MGAGGNPGPLGPGGCQGTEGGTGWRDVSGSLTPKEAVSVSGNYADVRNGFARYGTGIAPGRRVMDKGLFSLALNLNTIREQLRLGSQARDRGELARTFGWTVGAGDAGRAAVLLDGQPSGARTDGLIYGNRASCYPDGRSGLSGCGIDDSGVREALSAIVDYVRAHPDTRRMATPQDLPFGN